VRTSDTLARFGGDEFVIIMDGEDDGESIISQATHLARRIQHQFTTPFIMNQRDIFISSSIGISICPDNSETVDDLLKHADSAMYHAKNQGRAQFRFFDQALNENLMEKLELESDLRYALERDELKLLYQPKVAAQDGGKILGVEVLLRWKHPEKGYISPVIFIPIAEETGLIKEIGAWVLRTACQQNQEWVQQGFENLHISVNLSGAQFRQVNFDQILQQTLDETKLAPSKLDLEITEGVTIEDFDKTVDLLTRFHNIGVSVSIDDFGTGYSSMSYLKKFNVDKLKIDKSFVDGVPESESSQSIVMAIIALGHSLDFTVVAEGVETREQYDFLVDAGVDEIQGFYVSRPLPKEEFEKFYKLHADRLRVVS
jgi:EAL domain-containing protein (putative c-di-GMP-specific phosphodiesterase class I)